ncbi:MAG TPA: aryl-sulfate sulfotransferase [Terriglobia bacterium]|nr:aryl-sulfate sulfotransferase [Terriglobia bacterium]
MNPSPVVASISPSSIIAGSSSALVTVTGSGFTPQSTIQLGATSVATSFVTTTQLTAIVPSAQLASAGTLAVTVVTPSPGGGTSSAANLAVKLVVAVTPPSLTLSVTQTQTFAATITGSSNQGVTWAVNGIAGGNATVGTVDASGDYVAPAMAPSPNTVTLTATSAADPTQQASATVVILNPSPVLSSISPSTLNAGSPNTLATITGSGFTPQSSVLLGATALATTFASLTQLTATIPGAQLATAGTLGVQVVNPSPGGGTSSAANLVVKLVVAVTPPNPTLFVTQMQTFAATITGSSNQGVTWAVNGIAGGNATWGTVDASGNYTAPATPPSPNTVTLTATSTADPTQQASAAVVILNPSPVLSSISPSTLSAGSPNTLATITGSGFTPQSSVLLGTTPLATTFSSATQLMATFPAAQLTSGGTLAVSVVNPSPGGGTSSAANLVVKLVVAVTPPNPTLFVTQIQPFVATITGSSNQGVTWAVNGIAGGNATWGTVDALGNYTAPAIPPSPNTVTLTATSTADPTASASASVQVVSPSPVVTSISPTSVNAGSPNTVITVTGSGFTPQSTVQLGGTSIATSFVTSTQLTATLPAAQLVSAGTLLVDVVTPSPGGGTSGTANLTVIVVTVAVNPPISTVFVGQTQTFTPTVTSASSLSVTWSVNGIAGGNAVVGTVDASGNYNAPAIPPTPNTLTLTATSVADPTKSASAALTILYPAPLLTSLTPAAVLSGTGATTVTLTGSNFFPFSAVAVGGAFVTTTFLSSTQLSISVPATMLTSPAVLNLTVSNSGPGGGVTAPLSMTVVSTGQVTATNNLLVAQYSISSPRDATMSVEFGPDTNYGLKTWSQPVPTGGGTINMLVAGMKQTTTYHMRATLVFPDGSQFVDSDKTFTTGTLAASLVPQVTVTNPSGLMPSPGVLMGHLVNFFVPNYAPLSTVAFDMQGNVIWYYNPGIPNDLPQPIKLMPNGHIIVNLGGVGPGVNVVQEIDLAGNIIRQFTPADLTQWLANAGYSITVANIHHDLLILPNGHLILLVNSIKYYDNLPGFPGTTGVIGDLLLDVDPNNNVTWVWSTFDRLDVNRHPAGFPDWTHSNGLVYSQDDGNLLLSIRHQSWVIKIDYRDGQGTGDIIWRLGYQGDFTIDSGLNPDWQYAEHYPSLASPNSTGVFNLMVYDNGDDRVMDSLGASRCGPPYPTTFNKTNVAGTIQCYTRAVNFQVNEYTRTVSTTWQYNASPIYSFWGGSTQLLSTGNYVMDLNTPADIDPVSGNPIPPLDDEPGARYLELTPDQPPRVVMQMEVTNQNAYRLTHLPSLYPGVQW